jgi:nitrite reductase/ring-hydroxylating ferredoxin subunit
MADYVKVAKTGDIPPGEMKAFDVNGEEVAVANHEGAFYAFGNICPHEGADLAGASGAVVGQEVVCMLHDSAFRLSDGVLIDGPASDPLPIFSVRIEGDDILVGRE